MAFLKQLGISLISGCEDSHGLPLHLNGSTSLHAEPHARSVSGGNIGIDEPTPGLEGSEEGDDLSDKELMERIIRDCKKLFLADLMVEAGNTIKSLKIPKIDDEGDLVFELEDKEAVIVKRSEVFEPDKHVTKEQAASERVGSIASLIAGTVPLGTPSNAKGLWYNSGSELSYVNSATGAKGSLSISMGMHRGIYFH